METVIYDLAHAIDFVLDEGHDPGTGMCYHNGYFEMHDFWQHADDDCDCGGWDEGRPCKDFCAVDRKNYPEQNS